MKKIIILIIAVFLLTGCAVKYNLTINEDLTIVEEAKLTGTQEFFDNYYKTTKKNVLKEQLEIYQDILNDNNYTSELIEEDIPYVKVIRKYDSVNDYISKTKLLNGYFDEIKYTEDGNKKKIETIGFNDNEPDNPDRFDVREMEIAIKCPYKVINHNAIAVDNKTNTFYYSLSDTNNKILIEYDASVKFNPNANIFNYIIMCILAITCVWTVVAFLDKKNNKKKKV